MSKTLCICIALATVFLNACNDKTGEQVVTAPASSPTTSPEKTLLAEVAIQWVKAVNSHVTADGSTVAQVLLYTQHNRPTKFKYQALSGGNDIGYNGVTGEPSGVDITYWIGSKRGTGESYVDLGYDMTPQGAVISPSASDTPATLALEGGRQSFVQWIDKIYENDCRDLGTNKLTC